MSAPRVYLATVNGEPHQEAWGDRRDSTLVTFTLPKRDVDGAYYGVKNLLWANARMMAALEAMRAGDHGEAEKNIDRAIVEMTSANAAAERLYATVKAKAQRARFRGRRP